MTLQAFTIARQDADSHDLHVTLDATTVTIDVIDGLATCRNEIKCDDAASANSLFQNLRRSARNLGLLV